MSTVITAALKSLTVNINIGVISGLIDFQVFTDFSSHENKSRFLVLQMSVNFELYSGHYKYRIVETLDSVIFL